MKYANYSVVFQEIPDETTLSINITNCPCHCPGCHSAYLWRDEGEELNEAAIDAFIAEYGADITCVCFMGGDAEPQSVELLARYIHRQYPVYRVGWYSGRQYIPHFIDRQQFQYIKVGPYIAHLGPLNNPHTNQKLLKQQPDGTFVNITSKFWK